MGESTIFAYWLRPRRESDVTYAPRIVLQLPLSAPARLAPFVEACLHDGVELIAVAGDGCEAVHDAIDDIIIGDGDDDSRHIITSWHEGESLEEVIEFAEMWSAGKRGKVQLVRL